jgi:hypothetical protein
MRVVLEVVSNNFFCKVTCFIIDKLNMPPQSTQFHFFMCICTIFIAYFLVSPV